jgi:uncharacterized protein
MAPTPLPEPLDAVAGQALLGVARASLSHGLHYAAPLAVDPLAYPAALRAPAASFVTLRIRGSLRGCTGRLASEDPLVVDAARNAFRSGFEDPRFEPLRADELPELALSISVLSPLEPMLAESEGALLAALRPGVDGLVLREGGAMATFLPEVWSSLPSPRAFLDALLQKSGLPRGYWSPSLRFERYRTLQIHG